MKREFPGDREFTYERYWELPYAYVLNAVTNANKLRFNELHENEVPLALLACQQAEINRDRKQRKKPYEMSDFYCYKSGDDKDSIDAPYGSASKRLIEMGMFPNWGLFVYKDLMKNADKAKPPEVLAYVSEWAIILAPRNMDDACKGLLIATEKASYRTLLFDVIKDGQPQDNNEQIRIRMPVLRGKTIAIENCMLDIMG